MKEVTNNYEEAIEKAYDAKLMRRLLKYAKSYWYNFALAAILLLVATMAELAGPYLTKIAIDNYIGNGNAKALGTIGMIFVVLIVAAFLFNLLQIYILNYTGQTIIFNIRQEIFSHIQRLPLSFFDKNPVGRLVTRVTNDTETLNEMYTSVLVSLLKDIFILAGTIAIMFKMNIKLALLSLAIIPIVVVVTVIFRIKIRSVYRSVRIALARINSLLSENISGMRIIQIFNKEEKNFGQFKKANNDYYRASIREITMFGIFRPAIEVLGSLTIALILWYGGNRVIEGTVEFGMLYAFVNYIVYFFQPINDLAEKYNILQSAMASSERIFMILDFPIEEDNGKVSLDTIDISLENDKTMDIQFENVWFAYNGDDWVLRNVSFDVPAGTTVAIVGATGAGKTSIISLLNRLYEIQQGSIFINGIDIKNIRKESLRKNVGIVLQDVFLFSGTVSDNIRLNDHSITDENLLTVSRYVNAHKFINNLPSKYDEEVGERGATFSSGQRQLLAFARALAFDPPILVLDEATANIDTETEALIQDALSKLTKNRTTVVIAHRLSTIQHADNIIVLHKGKIREMGNHHELLEKKGMYYNLYQMQYS